MDRRGFVRVATVGALGVVMARPARASLARAVPIEELVGRSQHVVVGEPLDAESVWEELGGRKHIVTYTRVRALGGVGTTLDSPTIDGEPRDAPKREVDDRLPFVLAAGVDVLHSFNTRAAFVFGMRYAYSDRPENHRYLGIGSHLVRIGAGVRIRIGS